MEKIKGSLIYHLPFKRNMDNPPEVTLVVIRRAENLWAAGVSVCSKKDQFSKKIGRTKANYRLKGCPITAGSVGDLLFKIQIKFNEVDYHHPMTVSTDSLRDLHHLKDAFNKMRIA